MSKIPDIHPPCSDLVSDAILGTYFRLVRTQGKEESEASAWAVPLLYSFLDYVRLALPGAPNVVIAPEGANSGLSTTTGGLVSVSCEYQQKEHVSFHGLRMFVENPDESRESIELLQQFLPQLDNVSSHHLSGGNLVLTDGLKTGLGLALKSTDTGAFSDNSRFAERADSAPIDSIVKQVHLHLSEALESPDLSYEIFLQCWQSDGHAIKRLPYCRGDNGQIRPLDQPHDLQDDPSRSSWRPVVERACKSGFLQMGTVGDRDELLQLLCIPCHFLGAPWIVVCHYMREQTHDNWWAYTTYRDHSLRLNDSLRLAALQSLCYEMVELFPIKAVEASVSEIESAVNAAWEPLIRVFPISQVHLKTTSLEHSVKEDAIRLDEHRWRIVLSEERNPYFPGLLRSGLRSGAKWGELTQRMLQRGVVMPINAMLQGIALVRVEQQRQESRKIAQARESAIVHYGHTLGHRLSPIKAYFEGNKDSLKRAIANAKFLDDLSVVLQAINLASTEELYRHPKKSRFLKYAREDGPLNIAEKIRNEWPMLAESFQPTTLEGDDTSQMRVMVLIQFSGCLPDSDLDYMLVDSVNGEACRPCEAFYSQLFSELLLNVVRYGVIPKDEFDLAAKQGHVLVELAFQDISCGDRTLPCIVMSNLIGKKSPPPWLRKTCWTPWPADRENDGPGMAIAVLRRLGLGEMYYRYEPTYRLFDVAVWLRGLRTKET